jgi:mannosyltransferase OCH1-like enzyme
VIVQYWDQGVPPSEIELLASSWKRNNPEYSYELYDSCRADKFIFDNFGGEVLKLFQNAALPAMRSDIFRIAYILKNGGVYVDVATECVKSLSTLRLEEKVELVLMRKWHGMIWNGFLMASPGGSYIEKLWCEILKNLKLCAHRNVWACTGPGVMEDTTLEIDPSKTVILEQVSLREYFDLVNDLPHKKEGLHWSEVQKEKGIFIANLSNE